MEIIAFSFLLPYILLQSVQLGVPVNLFSFQPRRKEKRTSTSLASTPIISISQGENYANPLKTWCAELSQGKYNDAQCCVDHKAAATAAEIKLWLSERCKLKYSWHYSISIY
jgi:hypothetical protein